MVVVYTINAPQDDVYLEQFKDGNNWDKGQERMLSASADRRYFGNKTLNVFEQSGGVK